MNAVTRNGVAILMICLFTSLAWGGGGAPDVKVVEEDSVKWKRDPFIGGSPKTPVAALIRNGNPLKKAVPVVGGLGNNKQSVVEEEINVQGIMQADRVFHAMINGRVVKAGDMIGGVTIHMINRYEVVVVNGKKEKVVYDIYQGRIDRGKK